MYFKKWCCTLLSALVYFLMMGFHTNIPNSRFDLPNDVYSVLNVSIFVCPFVNEGNCVCVGTLFDCIFVVVFLASVSLWLTLVRVRIRQIFNDEVA